MLRTTVGLGAILLLTVTAVLLVVRREPAHRYMITTDHRTLSLVDTVNGDAEPVSGQIRLPRFERWANDGASFYVTSMQSASMYRVHLPTGHVYRLLDFSGLNRPTWSPDGEWFLFRVTTNSDEWIFRAEADGTVGTYLIPPPDYPQRVVISPDARRLALKAGDGYVYVMSAWGGDVRAITGPYEYDVLVHWLNDEWLLAQRDGVYYWVAVTGLEEAPLTGASDAPESLAAWEGERLLVQSGGVLLTALDTTSGAVLWTTPAPPSTTYWLAPDWAWMLWQQPAGTGFDLMRIALPGGAPERVDWMDWPIAALEWSPDGQWFAYSHGPDQPLHLMQPDGTQRREITIGTPLEWSPHSDWLLIGRSDGLYRDNNLGLGPGEFVTWVPVSDREWCPGVWLLSGLVVVGWCLKDFISHLQTGDM